MMSKKGISQWMSFVLITAFAVVLSVFMYDWMTGYSSDVTDDIKEDSYDTDICNSVAVSIDDACFDGTGTPKLLNTNITNRHDLRVTKLLFRLYKDTSVSDFEITELDIGVRPKLTREVSVNTTLSDVTYVEVIPGTEKKGFDQLCSNRIATADVVPC